MVPMKYREEETQRATFVNVREKVIDWMVQALDEAEIEKRLVDWNEFFKYSCGVWDIPVSVIMECLNEAKIKTKYLKGG